MLIHLKLEHYTTTDLSEQSDKGSAGSNLQVHEAVYRSDNLIYITQTYEFPEWYLNLLLDVPSGVYSVQQLDGSPFCCLGDHLTTASKSA